MTFAEIVVTLLKIGFAFRHTLTTSLNFVAALGEILVRFTDAYSPALNLNARRYFWPVDSLIGFP